ncbi:hypothetical protein M8312_09330 [Sphingomonas sp. KRR8]|uniref:hypothetical protein n=1 Tax=Sphingomonas sp. KRR8 TaxID=2942996 RepID=UPI0020225001|nr:hypothetical protein [Sphingomonas sp. KRR8]URD60002.1 hypothetical protein M8312_09330 [Sphingomonas sp. KRR8]
MIGLALLMIFGADPALTGPTASATRESVDRVAGKDPNEVICEVQEELGSRLKGHKVCATRAEWAERRRQARTEVDLQQQNRPTKGN